MAKDKNNPPTQLSDLYEVTGTTDVTVVGADNRLVLSKRITVRTAMGDIITVEIPKQNFDAETAKAIIEKEVDELLKLRGA